MNNLTEGRPLKLILRFAIPLLLGNLLQQAYNVIDYTIVGRFLGAGALAGVGASSSVQFLVLGFCTGLCAGFGIPVAQAFGADDLQALRRDFFHALVLSAASALVLTALFALLTHAILSMLSTPSDIYRDAYTYLLIIFLGIPFTILYNLMASVLRAIGDSRTPFLFLAVAACLNIVLDLLAVAVWHMGVAGAALATVASQAVSGLLCALHIVRHTPTLWLTRANMRFVPSNAKLMLSMGIPMGLQTSITAIGSMVMQSANNGLGSVYVSAYTVALRIKQVAMCPYEAFPIAVSTFCSQNLGARKYDRIRTGYRLGIVMGLIYGAVAGGALLLFGRSFASLFLTDAAVLDAAKRYLFFSGSFLWALSPLCFSRMTIQGLGRSSLAILSGVVEMIARASVSLFLVPRFGYAAICIADQAAWLSASCYVVPVCLWCIKNAKRFQVHASSLRKL